ncbi:MAG: glycerophosphodiester phosphodiesterase family protein [Candidatus Saccharibacteria bacterium]|nr:glycerophosphodiester phosphodiesterase family protein [Candidatus Saccharibacteria bacterium]
MSEEKAGFLRGLLVAHRGKYDNMAGVPENSLAAFRKAVKEGMAIELDVHLSRDGRVVVFHDSFVRRMTGGGGVIVRKKFPEIRRLRLMGTTEKIPELSEVLEVVKGKVPMIIEVKFDRMPGKLEREMVKILDEYRGKFAVKSFSPLTVKWFYQNRPEYIRGLLVNYKLWRKLGAILIWMAKPEFLSVDYRLYNNPKIQEMRKKMPVIAWTVKDEKTMERVRGYFDGLIM